MITLVPPTNSTPFFSMYAVLFNINRVQQTLDREGPMEWSRPPPVMAAVQCLTHHLLKSLEAPVQVYCVCTLYNHNVVI